ncbi:MAG: hypothetical protein AT711_04365 [Thermoproteus sp. CIS_19]|jgi:hypothetical protein|nr:MAG: hypothetical protein AT711_04365 [Thermoproteus sp. CIS_19]
MEIHGELSRLVIKEGPRRVLGMPLFLNLFGSVKALPAAYILGRFRRVYFEDERFRDVAMALCADCTADGRDGAEIVGRALAVEAYYNTIAHDVAALAPGIDSIAVPCFTGALGEAVAKRAREVEPGLTIVAARLGAGDCAWADAVYSPPPQPLPLPRALRLGPASLAVLSTALRASEEHGLYSTLALLTDWGT